VVELGVIPGHDEGARASRTAAHGGAGARVMAELDVGLRFDKGQDLVLDELCVMRRHGVVFEAAFGPLRIATTILDGDGDHGRKFVFGN